MTALGQQAARHIPCDIDICICGDRRSEHRSGTGSCDFNKPSNVGHHGAPNCERFELAVKK